MPMSDYMKNLRQKVGHTLLEVPTVSILVFNEDSQLLLVKHADVKRWTLPGGMIEPEELPAEAAIREMWEETGLFVKLNRIQAVYGGPEFGIHYSNGDQISAVMTVFEAGILAGEAQPDMEETLETAWFSLEAARQIELQPWLAGILEDLFRRDTEAYFEQSDWRPESIPPVG